jgi:hypothetical protein
MSCDLTCPVVKSFSLLFLYKKYKGSSVLFDICIVMGVASFDSFAQ